MKLAKHQRWLAGAVCLALAACSNMDSNRSSSSGMASDSTSGSGSANSMAGTASSPGSASGAMNSGSTTGSNYQSSNPGGTSSAMASSDTSTPSTSSSTAQTSYGTVQSIDSMQRQDVGVGTLGAAAAGGSMGSPTDRVYRVSVRMDDGTTQTVVVDNKPSYKNGDRVRYSNGTLEKY